MTPARAYVKKVAIERRGLWAAGQALVDLRGEVRLSTKNTIYQFRDGIVYSVTRQNKGFMADPTELIGMRLVGWLPSAAPYVAIREMFRPGAYAVLFRPAEEGGKVALTSAAMELIRLRASDVPAPPKSGVHVQGDPPRLKGDPTSVTRMNAALPRRPSNEPPEQSASSLAAYEEAALARSFGWY